MLVNTEDLEKLAETCLAAAKSIKSFLADNGHKPMSFDQNGPSSFPQAPPEVQLARLTMKEAAHRLKALVSEPEDCVTNDIYPTAGYCRPRCEHHSDYPQIHTNAALRYVFQYGIAKAVPLNSTISYDDLASKQGLDAGQLKQNLRKLMVNAIFCEPQESQVGHTASSKTLLNPLIHSYNAFLVNETIGYASKNIETLDKFGHGNHEPNKAMYNYHCNTDKIMYNHLEEVPEVRERFSNLMGYTAMLPALSRDHIVAGFDWTALGKGSVVDLAGNLGQCSVSIAQANPLLSIVVQDLPQIVKASQDPASSFIPANLKSQISFQVHDFWQPQTAKADVYFMRMIMHLFSDKLCIKILRNTVAAMKTGSRIVIMDQVLPPVGGFPRPIEEFMRAQDMQMMTLTNAKERDYEQWVDLVKRTDSRLKLKNVVTPPGSAMSLIEIVFEGPEGEALKAKL